MHAQLASERAAHASERSRALSLQHKRNLRGAVGACADRTRAATVRAPWRLTRRARRGAPPRARVPTRVWPEYVSSTTLKEALATAGKPVAVGGVQKLLSAAALHDPRLRAVISLLAARHGARERDVLQCLDALYHALSKDFHGKGDTVVVREVDWQAPSERLALCAVLEAYAVEYEYVDAAGEARAPSPYALSPEDLVALVRLPGGGSGSGP